MRRLPHSGKSDMRTWLLILILGLCALPTAANAWWQTDWTYRTAITVDASPKGANLSGQVGRTPVLVRLHTGNFSFKDALPTGADLRFVAGDDKTPLAFHIESFDPTLEMAEVWVDVPDLAGGATKQIWLYYGNKKAAAVADTTATYDPDFGLIYHFADTGGQAPHDATAYASNATGTPAGLDEAAIIGKGAKFNGHAFVGIPANAALNVAAGAPFTFSAWVKSDGPQAQAALYARRDGGGALLIGLDQNAPFVQVTGGTPLRLAAPQAIAKGEWTHIAVSADGKSVILYVNGAQAATASGSLPSLTTPATLGGDAGGLTGFVGEMDEVRLSKVARSAGLIQADVLSQGRLAKLVTIAQTEKKSGIGFRLFGVIVQQLDPVAWVVIIILGVIAVMSWWVIWTKSAYVNRVSRANKAFEEVFVTSDDPLGLAEIGARHKVIADSCIFRIYRAGVDEMKRRAERGGPVALTPGGVEVVRALMHTAQVRESQRLGSGLVVLTIAIAGGPFLGLLGTVIGVMLTFARIALTGDVNINNIAPGISAALLATVAGLGVAIPSLFGYNYIQLRNRDVGANMSVFVDEFITKVAELYSAAGLARAAE